ncbi:DUF222 domain-containing protein [Pseudolysinimonas sp.]|uniref:HNH endonuclease n=1 Tax=Pseudolysinimonas sp. TaxID=2680009 RepID=UPI00286C8B10|nr:DUF222 domain-containing protein [Pseudolysinimonas sp.]
MTSYPPAIDDFGYVDPPETAWDESRPDTRVDSQLARAEFAAGQIARATAAQMAAIARVLAEARRHPEVYVALTDEPTKRQIDIAVDAAIADLAMRLTMAEGTVMTMARQADLLRTRAPRLWSIFLEGEISVANARCVAVTLESLPENSESDGTLDGKALELASLAPARFKDRMRTLRERLHPRSLTDRHTEAACGRRFWRDNDRDGMAWLGLHLTAPDAETAWQRIDGIARHLADAPDETRTLDQLRADVAADMLTGRSDPATAPRVTVGVLVPMLSLLGLSDEPATLEGYGPIDADTARKLTAHAPSFYRILTHPVSSTILDVDRTRYRPPADLKRWLALRDGTCRFYGCGRSARTCDLDHSKAWSKGGTTSAGNLGHLHPRHHTVKEESRWRVEQHEHGRLTWTSPTGATWNSDPPPF